MICPDARKERHREILFIRETHERIVIWEGPKHTQEEARDISGIQTVYWTSQFEAVFRGLALESDHIYLNTNEHLRADVSVETRDRPVSEIGARPHTPFTATSGPRPSCII